MSKQEMANAASKYRSLLSTGTVLSVDPSSGSAGSMPGWAVFHKGALVDSGLLQINHKAPINARLRQLMELLGDLEEAYGPGLLLVEKIRGNRAHNYLRWACGCVVAALSCPHVEVCISTWRSYINKDTYDKNDENDAVAIGQSMINLAAGVPAPAKPRRKREQGKTSRVSKSVSRNARGVRRTRRRPTDVRPA